MEFFATKIREGQDKYGGKTLVSPIKTLMELYTNQTMIVTNTGERVLHFEFLIKSWCSPIVNIFYHLKKYEIKQRNTFILSWNYYLNKYEHQIRILYSDVMGVICSFL